MGSPVSVVVAEIVMQNIEERALTTCRQTIPLWLRYVDDTFTAVHKDEIDEFHDHLNEQNADIQFTREVEEDGKLPFLDCLVSRDENTLRTTVYRKPTHTDRLLDESSYNPTSHKATTIKSAFFSRPREKWHMMEKMPILIFRPEVPYDESINVVYFLGSQLSVFSRKFSKTASSAHRRKMPEINAAMSTDTKTLLLDIAEGTTIF